MGGVCNQKSICQIFNLSTDPAVGVLDESQVAFISSFSAFSVPIKFQLAVCLLSFKLSYPPCQLFFRIRVAFVLVPLLLFCKKLFVNKAAVRLDDVLQLQLVTGGPRLVNQAPFKHIVSLMTPYVHTSSPL